MGSNSGDSLPASWVWWLGGDRLLVERAEVAVAGDSGEKWPTLLRGDVGSKSSCSKVVMGAKRGSGDRLLSDSSESVELAADGDTEPASLCGVKGASASSIWTSTSLWGRLSVGIRDVMLGSDIGLGSSS